MPIPIKYIPHNDNNIKIDYSFLFTDPIMTSKKTVVASDKDASLLFALWDKGEKIDDNTIKVSADSNITPQDISRLKTMGFLDGNLVEVKFTRKGKIVITTMALGEPNQFANKKEKKSYTEILASMNKKGKRGFRIANQDPKFSVNNVNKIDLRGI